MFIYKQNKKKTTAKFIIIKTLFDYFINEK